MTNAEIIFDDFKGKDPLPLANRGQTFVSLSGFLEILSKTELSSDKIDQRASRILLLKENPIATIPNETQNCVSLNLLYLTRRFQFSPLESLANRDHPSHQFHI